MVTTALALSLALALVLWTLASLSAERAGTLATALAWGAFPAAFALAWAWTARGFRRLGDDAATAQALQRTAPGFHLELLAAVELSRALGERHDFSPALARAFVEGVSARASAYSAPALIDRRPAKRAGAALALALLFTASAGALTFDTFFARLGQAFVPLAKGAASQTREPITGDVKLTYRYPAYTGLEPRTVEASGGEVVGPPSTEVDFETRADRDVREAVLVVNGEATALKVDGRSLRGRMLLSQSGQYHVAFMKGAQVLVAGPDVAVTVQPDAAPQVVLKAPADELEVDASEESLTIAYEASDDYGLSTLDLVYQIDGREQATVKLPRDDGRRTAGEYRWALAPLGLSPGQHVRYFIEAQDGDTVSGQKKGVSRTQTFKLYSAAEHRRAAMEAAIALWDRLVILLADRVESLEFRSTPKAESIKAGAPVDERSLALAEDLVQVAKDLSADKDAPRALLGGLSNAGETLRGKVRFTTQARLLATRFAKTPETYAVLGGRLSQRVREEAAAVERSVLYLESLLDKARMEALKEMAQELRSERRNLARLMEEFGKSQDAQTKEALLAQMQRLRERMSELMQRMAELGKGIRDEHLNQDALAELAQQEDLGAKLDAMEKKIREGNTEEALKDMQELAMDMDEMLDKLEEGIDEADQEADPELTRAYEEFQKSLEATVEKQTQVADATRAVKDHSKEALKERISKQGAALKNRLLEQTQALRKSYEAQTLDDLPFGNVDEMRDETVDKLKNLEEALKADDFDMAAQSAHEAEEGAQALDNMGQVARPGTELAEHLRRDHARVEKMKTELEGLFPQAGELLSAEDGKRLRELAQEQAALDRQGQALKEQMKDLADRAPVFQKGDLDKMEQASQAMGESAGELRRLDARKGHGNQESALQGLKSIQKSMEEAQSQSQRGGKGGLPMPMMPGGRNGPGKQEKVVIPDEDPLRASRELRKDVMDAMKQGAPEKYKDQVKRYYEELVK